MASTVPELVRHSATLHPQRIAILSAERQTCSYRQLARHIEETVETLAQSGLGAGDRVAVVLPTGPEMAAAFLAVSAAATCAPLNPTFREQEFAFYLQDLRAAALIVAADDPGASRVVAERLGIPVLCCRFERSAPAGCFELIASDGGARRSGAHAQNVARAAAPSDVALVLHTSGTTARPKQVPLTHANLCASARNITRTLHLGPSDRCLNVLPLFHIHGLVAAVLGTMASGGSLVASPGFLATHFFEWLEELEPTWFTAVPSMHHALLARARRLSAKLPIGRMRFVRSSSAPLPAAASDELEALFGAPVIDAYGMTEAAHQMASNPLPPAVRKAGSVGRAAGPEVAVVDEHGTFVDVGVTGEVVIRGENVTAGYDGQHDANLAAFHGVWFRTGDRGWLDADGFLFLEGRIKELINRGGEKIAPLEIDGVFSTHPAVAQAVAFGVPDARFGEEIGLAVVLRDGQRLSPGDLLAFAAERLADFKLPRHIVFVDDIPKGPTGKLQRVGLAKQLGVGKDTGVSLPSNGRPPSTVTERVVAETFAEVLRLERVHADESFFRLGGDSLLAVSISCRLEEKTRVEIPTYLLLEHDTVEALAHYIDRHRNARVDAATATQQDQTYADIPLTGQQEFHWTIETLFRGIPLNHRPGAIRVTGLLDVAALQSALEGVLARHAPLRGSVALHALRPRLVVAPAASCSMHMDDLSAMPLDVRQATLHETGRRFALESFDLLNGPLFKAKLVRLSATEHVLLINVHHMVFDGWSMSVLISDLAALYEARAGGDSATLPTLHTTYARHVERECSPNNRQIAGSLDYWRDQLKDLPMPFSPLVRKSQIEASHALGRELVIPFGAEAEARVAAIAKSHGATPFMAHLAVFAGFCRVLGAPEDLVVGAFVSRRSTPSVTRLIGCFYNLLPIRVDLSGDPTFVELVQRAKKRALAALKHQHVPYGHLVRALRPAGGRFFNIAFQCRNFPALTAEAGPVSFADLPFDWGLVHWDLLVEITPRNGIPEIRLAYRADAKESDEQHWTDAFTRAVEWAATANGTLSDLACTPR